ncbi:MAG: sigma-70 family RNA polymerase sigma factor, partial [Solirubrobacteraceae bacterium]
MARVAAGDTGAFEVVYDRYCEPAFSLAMYITGRRRAAEEATQDAFVSLWRSARRFDAERGSLKTWLLSTVRNRSIDWLRREARHDRDSAIDEALIKRLKAPDRTDGEILAQEESREAREALVSLPVEQRQVIELAFFKGLTQGEIARRVGVPLGTVKGRQRLGLAKLRDVLAGVPNLALAR